MNAITFNNVTAGYRDAPILKNLSFEIPEGSMSAVIGPNGSGKTTLLRVATGLLDSSQGSVQLFDKNVSDLPAAERSRLVGVVPQSIETPMAFTVSEIVMMGRTSSLPRWQHPSKNDNAIAERAMVFTDVVDMKDRVFSEMSAGERQRAVIAMVLAQEPRILLMDEATSHLDINHRLEVMQIIERLNKEQNTTVMMVSHDLNLAAEFCESLLLMNNGELVSSGSPETVLQESTLTEVYHCDVSIGTNSITGAITVSPSARLTSGSSGHGITVHVVAGGGSGEETLRRLSLCNYTVTCGVLNELDTDADIESDGAADKTMVGAIVGGGAFQGFLVDVATAEANGVKYLDDIGDDPAIAALFDVDGDGAADLTGCNEGWGCNVLIEELIAANGWEATITQVVGDFDALWAGEVEGFGNGEPVLSYVWAPSAFVAQLVPGEDVLWLSVRQDQGDSSEIALPPSQCPGQPCQLGLALNEIMAAGNGVFFQANPSVERLVSVVGIPLSDVAVQNLKMLLGEDSEADVKRHAAEWIADNRTVVDSWLDAARESASG